jgi:hypothetical protein
VIPARASRIKELRVRREAHRVGKSRRAFWKNVIIIKVLIFVGLMACYFLPAPAAIPVAGLANAAWLALKA